MIVKKVPTSKAAPTKTRAANVRALCDYIAGPAAGGDGGKVEHRDAMNLLNIDHESQVQEMIDLAEVAQRSARPVQHWIVSWREGEQPTAPQADEVVRILLGEMGLTQHQAIYALHCDTHNWHLHLAVNRVHPETERLVTVNGGFDHEIAHRAISRIEHAQRWQREANGLFVVQPGGHIERVRGRSERERRPSVRAIGREERTGERSAERVAIEDGAPIIRRAASWRELHEGLAREGMRFERKGSGALLWVGEQPVKASRAGRDCSMAPLEKRLGEYQPGRAREVREAERRRPKAIDVEPSQWGAYRAEYDAHRAERAGARTRLAADQGEEWKRLAEQHRRDRDNVFRQSWKGRGDALNAARSVIAMRQAQEKSALRDRDRRRRAELRKERGRFPSYEEWLAKRSPERAHEWRHRERQVPSIEGPMFQQPVPCDIRAFRAVVDGGHVHYHLIGMRGVAAFTDRGKTIDIRDAHREAVLAALQLSAQKWGTFTVHGGEGFRRTCVELAAEHGFRIANPELQDAIAAERDRLAAERARAATPDPPAPPKHGDRAYAPVTAADAYQVHRTDAEQRHARENIDESRLDAEVAVRLRLTGHDRREIAKAIQVGASSRRPQETRDWQAYAERTTDFAYGIPGKRLGDHLRAQVDRFLRLEGRRREELDLIPPRGSLSRLRL